MFVKDNLVLNRNAKIQIRYSFCCIGDTWKLLVRPTVATKCIKDKLKLRWRLRLLLKFIWCHSSPLFWSFLIWYISDTEAVDSASNNLLLSVINFFYGVCITIAISGKEQRIWIGNCARSIIPRKHLHGSVLLQTLYSLFWEHGGG